MQHDLATIIAAKILDSYYKDQKYSETELFSLSKLISQTIKEEQSKVGSSNFID